MAFCAALALRVALAACWLCSLPARAAKSEAGERVLVSENDEWRYLTTADDPPRAWNKLDFYDVTWATGRAALGYGDPVETTLAPADAGRRPGTAYFRKRFEIPAGGLPRALSLRVRHDDGVVVYLNGKEVYRANLPAGPVSARSFALRSVNGAEERVFWPVTLDPALLYEGPNLLAAQVHRKALQEDDLVFAAELAADRADTGEPPSVSFLLVEDGQLVPLGQRVPMRIDAVDPEGKLGPVQVFVDDEPAAVLEREPFRFTWIASEGSHRIRAVATDAEQRTGSAEITLSGVDNAPPIVRITAPRAADAAAQRAGTARVQVEVSDPDDPIRSVEFFVHEGELFSSPRRSLGTRSAPPYALELVDLAPGPHRISIVATDARGASTETSTQVEIGPHP